MVYCAGTWRGFYATALYGVMYFSPLVIRAILGKPDASGSEVALLTAIPFVAGAAVHSINALHSSRTGERRVHIAAPWIFGGVCMALVPAVYMNAKAAFALYILASAGIYSADGPDVSWVTSLMTGKQRALGLATVNMLANIGGFVGEYDHLIGVAGEWWCISSEDKQSTIKMMANWGFVGESAADVWDRCSLGRAV